MKSWYLQVYAPPPSLWPCKISRHINWCDLCILRGARRAVGWVLGLTWGYPTCQPSHLGSVWLPRMLRGSIPLLSVTLQIGAHINWHSPCISWGVRRMVGWGLGLTRCCPTCLGLHLPCLSVPTLALIRTRLHSSAPAPTSCLLSLSILHS
jgi:hypothetical protein